MHWCGAGGSPRNHRGEFDTRCPNQEREDLGFPVLTAQKHPNGWAASENTAFPICPPTFNQELGESSGPVVLLSKLIRAFFAAEREQNSQTRGSGKNILLNFWRGTWGRFPLLRRCLCCKTVLPVIHISSSQEVTFKLMERSWRIAK
ncbi:hypothetical protein AV530_015318 [Patagioenas fasciata monilis]|uniref:Uncharacterized protein n=1 Tax=Patagioenas fasciata monilis TaxID=372326 RepID=A0A1V4K1Y8_PATFA|nr:hypothetical protein AV530_015318 [Patagioenas fasciata monilis]